MYRNEPCMGGNHSMKYQIQEEEEKWGKQSGSTVSREFHPIGRKQNLEPRSIKQNWHSWVALNKAQ